MKDVLAREGRAALEKFAASNVLVGFDYDGTLAPLVGDPDRAELPPRTRALLAQVAERYPCAVLSGRSRRDLLRFLRGVPVAAAVGNHGVETEAGPAPSLRAPVARWRERLSPLAELPGVRIEDKGWSLSVHYRGAPRRRQVRDSILSAARALEGARVIGGKDVVSIVVPGAPHKGSALQQLCRRLSCDTAIYVGDDETDEDVFALAHPARLLTIRVGRRRRSQAGFALRRQGAIDDLLELLAGLRPRRALLRPS